MSQDTTNTTRSHSMVALCTAAMLLLLASPAVAKPTRCHLTYDVEGWSFFYKVARGTGRIKCANGRSANEEKRRGLPNRCLGWSIVIEEPRVVPGHCASGPDGKHDGTGDI